MRTTLTLDDDVAARLQAEARRSGRPFRTVVNEHLRAALAQRRAIKTLPPLTIVLLRVGLAAVILNALVRALGMRMPGSGRAWRARRARSVLAG